MSSICPFSVLADINKAVVSLKIKTDKEQEALDMILIGTSKLREELLKRKCDESFISSFDS